jgi:hypothetical protein
LVGYLAYNFRDKIGGAVAWAWDKAKNAVSGAWNWLTTPSTSAEVALPLSTDTITPSLPSTHTRPNRWIKDRIKDKPDFAPKFPEVGDPNSIPPMKGPKPSTLLKISVGGITVPLTVAEIVGLIKRADESGSPQLPLHKDYTQQERARANLDLLYFDPYHY